MKLLACVILMGMLILSCATNVGLPFYNTAQWKAFYTGGDGSSTEKAIVINTKDEKKTIEAENHYLDKTLTSKGLAYKINNRITYGQNGRVFDKVEVIVNNSIQEYHFDITMPTGQTIQP
jgi:hypothetical protein